MIKFLQIALKLSLSNDNNLQEVSVIIEAFLWFIIKK